MIQIIPFVCLNENEVSRLNQILTNGSLPAKHHRLAKVLLTVNESDGRRIPDFKAQLTAPR